MWSLLGLLMIFSFVPHSIELFDNMLSQLSTSFSPVELFLTGLHLPSGFACMSEEDSYVAERVATKDTDFVALYVCICY